MYLMLLWGMIEEEDGTISRREDDTSLRDVFEGLPNENIGVSLEGGRNSSNGSHSESDMQKVCKTGSRVKKPEEMVRA